MPETRDLLLRAISARQQGVVSWQQLTDAGWTLAAVQRAVRRRDLVRVHPRVYVDHTGPLTWGQRAWAAALWAEPAALCWDSATRRPDQDGPIHVAIDRSRRLDPPEGIRVHRLAQFSAMRRAGTAPPRLQLEHNALCRIGAAESELDVIALVTGVLSGPVSARALRQALALHPRLPRLAFVRDLIEDAASGTCSVLEYGYLTRVERAHGLPAGERQSLRLVEGRRQFRDVEYVAFGFVVELDSAFHDNFVAKDRDADRDLDDLAEGRSAARLRWGQVFGRPCRTAARLARALQHRGWDGRPHPCGPGCVIG